MNNFWLNRFREGRMVAYNGDNQEIKGKIGTVVESKSGWVTVQFEFPGIFSPFKKIFTVKKTELEVI